MHNARLCEFHFTLAGVSQGKCEQRFTLGPGPGSVPSSEMCPDEESEEELASNHKFQAQFLEDSVETA